ncbi:hypothetical protein PoB_006655300 [Plakobranchus ocellatus]|uniref:Uncharacterized protein n=1 Tax=Plakobranchus ocellatus TaxID=259542 RepID=A0AAV4D757_9GAST|nr:hypothetical protein PoB_006655300 [Plakobranchus ocellatus]
MCIACPQQGDLRLSGTPLGQGGTRALDLGSLQILAGLLPTNTNATESKRRKSGGGGDEGGGAWLNLYTVGQENQDPVVPQLNP